MKKAFAILAVLVVVGLVPLVHGKLVHKKHFPSVPMASAVRASTPRAVELTQQYNQFTYGYEYHCIKLREGKNKGESLCFMSVSVKGNIDDFEKAAGNSPVISVQP